VFGRKTKPNPAERVPELLIQLKSGQDESRRSAAAEELREYDPKGFPEILTGLIDALGRDASPSVRAEAAASLAKIRPISQKAGYALEQAVSNDGSMRVRLAARQALWHYHLVGYRSGQPAEPQTNDKADATVSAPPGPSTPASAAQRPTTSAKPGRAASVPFRETPEPPLADPFPATVNGGTGKTPATPVSRPQTGVPVPSRLVPVAPPRLQPVPHRLTPPPPAPGNAPALKPADSTPPPAKSGGEGPALPPPG
jgi:hypothetical protein